MNINEKSTVAYLKFWMFFRKFKRLKKNCIEQNQCSQLTRVTQLATCHLSAHIKDSNLFITPTSRLPVHTPFHNNVFGKVPLLFL